MGIVTSRSLFGISETEPITDEYIDQFRDVLNLLDRDSRRITEFKNNTCPLCWKTKTHFHVHHAIWRMDGGRNEKINLLKICSSCHGRMTMGGELEDKALDVLSCRLMMGIYGLRFFLMEVRLKRPHSPNDREIIKTIVSQGICVMGRHEFDLGMKRESMAQYLRMKWAIDHETAKVEWKRIEESALRFDNTRQAGFGQLALF